MMKNKRYDENLNDYADSIITCLRSELKSTIRCLIFFGILIGISFVVTFILIGTLQNTIKERDKYKATLVKEEAMLSLEYNIGYWFINKPSELNDTILYDFLVENGAWYPDILLKQAKIESGNYTSNMFKVNNNLYGMRRVYKRQTTQSGENNGYGIYNNWCLSVLDRLLWDIFTFKNEKPDRETYLNAMRIYAEDSEYINKIQ